ncbi:hypothetical protein DPMN_096458 [Dreissena polymorpha]|uniref:Uncharacterized protein n=1 Tax=Dreissena polymorpha TaxID=45954 RepID=A0A9D4R5G2_DREPO|nr:hypothetical protein DPMN_096458 [Dreissena polymorpha]
MYRTTHYVLTPLFVSSSSGGFGTCFVDQSFWQSSVAAKPRQGVLGFLAGGLVWFSIPFALASTMGLGYIALSAYQDTSLLSEEEVNQGMLHTTQRYGHNLVNREPMCVVHKGQLDTLLRKEKNPGMSLSVSAIDTYMNRLKWSVDMCAKT